MTKRYESFCQGLGYHPDEVKLSLRQPGRYLVHCCWAEICFGESVPYVEVLSSQLFAVFTRLSKEWCLQLFRLHSLGLNLVHGVTPLRNVVNANILILKPKYCDLFEYLGLLLVVMFSQAKTAASTNTKGFSVISAVQDQIFRVLHIYLVAI